MKSVIIEQVIVRQEEALQIQKKIKNHVSLWYHADTGHFEICGPGDRELSSLLDPSVFRIPIEPDVWSDETNAQFQKRCQQVVREINDYVEENKQAKL